MAITNKNKTDATLRSASNMPMVCDAPNAATIAITTIARTDPSIVRRNNFIIPSIFKTPQSAR
jgi:hypothetical protein